MFNDDLKEQYSTDTDLNSFFDFTQHGQKILNILKDAYLFSEKRKVMTVTNTTKQRFKQPNLLPNSGQNFDEILAEVKELIFNGYCNILHPQYFGYTSPRPLPISIIGDFLSSGLNQTPGAWRAGPAATVIENETLRWLAEFIGYSFIENHLPPGIFTSGGSMANATAIKLARDEILGINVQNDGMQNIDAKPTIYISEEGHFSITRSLDFLGLGRNSLRKIPIDEYGCIDLNILEKTILEDKASGYLPLCIIGIAGTSALGAIDNFAALGVIANNYGMWFHIDAAAGGAFAKLPAIEKFYAGLNAANSITIDPCKWLFVPFGMGCLLVKDSRMLLRNFQTAVHYWENLDELDTFQMGFPGTRQWRSLGLWMAFKNLGSEGYLKLLATNLKNITYLSNKVKMINDFELLMEPKLPVCSFRIKNEASC